MKYHPDNNVGNEDQTRTIWDRLQAKFQMVQELYHDFIAADTQGLSCSFNYDKNCDQFRLWWRIKVRFSEEAEVEVDHSKKRTLAFKKSKNQKNSYAMKNLTLWYKIGHQKNS